VFGLLSDKIFGKRRGDGSGRSAKNRLQMVLVQDRSGLSSLEMENFQKDLLGVMTKYFLLERNALDIEWQRSENTVAMIINTPVMGRKPGDAVAVGAA